MIILFNKIDAYTFEAKDKNDLTPLERKNFSLNDLQRMWLAKIHNDCIFISAKNKINIDEFKSLLYKRVKQIHQTRYPYDDFLYSNIFDIDEE